MRTKKVILHLRLCFYLLLGISLLFSCIPQKKLQYLQDQIENESRYTIKPYDRNLIKPNDELNINVSSFDDINFNYFQSTAQTGINQGSTEMGLSLSSFAVKDDGTIYFPILGNVKLAGLTLNQATELLTAQLKPFFDQPTVVIRFAYKKVTVLGEVKLPGYYTYSKEQLSIFEALGLAGDMTVHGDRRKIYLLRNKNNQEIEKIKLDITTDGIFTSEFYFLKADDVLYVSPRASLAWSSVPAQLSLIFSGVTATILILNYFTQ